MIFIHATRRKNTKAERITRVVTEFTDHDLAKLDSDPDQLLRIITRSRNGAAERLDALAELGRMMGKGKR